MTSYNLSYRQAQIYNFIVGYMLDNVTAPSIREIGAAVGLSSTSSVASHVNALKKKGLVESQPNSPRTLKPVGYELIEIEDPEYEK